MYTHTRRSEGPLAVPASGRCLWNCQRYVCPSAPVGRTPLMIPQPLFNGAKPLAGAPGDVSSKHDSAQSAIMLDSPTYEDRERSPSPSRSSGSMLPRSSLSPPTGHRRRSTSGEIPISPPSFIARKNLLTIDPQNAMSPLPLCFLYFFSIRSVSKPY